MRKQQYSLVIHLLICSAFLLPLVVHPIVLHAQDCNGNGVPDTEELPQQDLPPLLENGGSFGFVVAAGDTFIAAGAPGDDQFATDSGAVVVYEILNNRWTETDRLKASDAEQFDNLGTTVAVSGNILVAGAPFEDQLGNNAGAVYVFERIDDVWQETAKLTAMDTDAGDRFGAAVDIESEMIVVGAYGRDGAYIFERIAGTWEEAELIPDNGLSGLGEFGRSVAIDNGRVAVGTPYTDTVESSRGAVFIFEKQAGSWSESARISDPDAIEREWFGFSMTFQGSELIIGAYRANRDAYRHGIAVVFNYSNGEWMKVQEISPTQRTDFQLFGADLTVDGNMLAVTTQHWNPNEEYGDGFAYLFEKTQDRWKQVAKLDPRASPTSNAHAYRTALIGDQILVGDLLARRIKIWSLESFATDCFGDGMIDECRADCNENGIPDICEIANAGVDDCDANGVPDDCEMSASFMDDAIAAILAGTNSDEALCRYDLNRDHLLDGRDIAYLIDVLTTAAGCDAEDRSITGFVSAVLMDSQNSTAICLYDGNSDGMIDGRDIEVFVEAIVP